jgi:hypothetical protein
VSGDQVSGGLSEITSGKQRFLSVTEIDLDYSKTEDSLLSWLELCRELKSFRLQHGGS